MSLGANLLSIFVPSYFLTVTKRSTFPFSYSLFVIHLLLRAISLQNEVAQMEHQPMKVSTRLQK